MFADRPCFRALSSHSVLFCEFQLLKFLKSKLWSKETDNQNAVVTGSFDQLKNCVFL